MSKMVSLDRVWFGNNTYTHSQEWVFKWGPQYPP